MKVDKKKRSPIVRALGFAVAMILMVALFPFNALELFTAYASTYDDTNYNYITIDGYDDSVEETVSKGGTYTLRKAYIGGNPNAQVGDNVGSKLEANQTFSSGSLEEATYVSSSVTVTYGGNNVTISEDSDEYYFTASKQGTYTITYSYTYTVNSKEYTNSYDMTVESVVSSVSIDIPTDGKYVLPSVIDLTLFNEAVEAETITKEIYIPEVEVTDEDGEEVEVTYVANELSGTPGNVVVVSMYGGNTAETVTLQTNDNGIYIDSSIFTNESYGTGDYTITFSYYENGIFVNYTTKTITVSNSYYTDYELVLDLETDWTDNGETGVENDLPVATGITGDDTTPANEAVDVVYKVEVKFYATDSGTTYEPLSTEVYEVLADDESNADTAVIYVEDGKTYLCDPTSFKPLEDGYYTFIYTITDFYGNTKSTDQGSLVYDNITDETDPTPVLYDASEYDGETYVDASDKFATRAVANGVIVYAIGIDDNVSTAEDATLIRKVMTSSTEKFIIEDYDAYNLVFNYNDASGSGAWSDLLTNNYQLRKLEADAISAGTLTSILDDDDATEIDSDADMLKFLSYYNFLIVIDNSNYEVIYDLFSSVVTFDSSITSADTMLTWLQSSSRTEAEIAALGFAYIDVDETFGASTSQTNVDGMGTGYYYVHYIATDAAGNETDSSHRIYLVSSFTDDTSPEITFSTTLKKAYSEGSTITFTAPTATDSIDSNLSVKTLYRYVGSNGKTITNDTLEIAAGGEAEVLLNNDGEAATEVDLIWILKDLYSKADSDGKFTSGTLYETYATDYAKYLGSADWTNGGGSDYYWDYSDADADGYIELTDNSASSYSIDLSYAPTDTAQVQILVYVYDDSGNFALLCKTVNVSNSNDEYAPSFISYNYADDPDAIYYQSETISLPTLVIADDAIDYVSFSVGVTYVADDGSTTKITPSGSAASTPVGSKYKMSIDAGSFVASYAGSYTAYIAVKDDAGNMIVAFASYTAEGVEVVQTPEFSNLTMEKTQEYEINDYSYGDTIEIDIPTVTYDIENSITYDVFDSTATSYDDDTIVLLGVYEDGTVDFSTGLGSSYELDIYALGLGDHTLVYTANIISYKLASFAYAEEGYSDSGYSEGGYFTPNKIASVFSSTSISSILPTEDGSYLINYNSAGDYNYILTYDAENEEWVHYTYTNGTIGDTAADVLTDDEISTITSDLVLYHLVSDTYTISIVDSVDPVIANYSYTAISKSDVTTEYIHVYGLEASDTYGLDVDQCSITISCTLATSSQSSKTLSGSEAFEDYDLYKLKRESYDTDDETGNFIYAPIDGTYKIVYTAVDLAGNTTTATYTIAVGDNTAPTITIEDDFCDSSYEIGTLVTLDLTKITFDDASGINYETLTYTLTNSSGETIDFDETTSTDDSYVYDLDEVDTYTFTIYVEDMVGWGTTKTVEFTVEAKSTDSTSVYQVVGIVLIVVSVLVLVGVIVYFIVSKVKLDKELKK